MEVAACLIIFPLLLQRKEEDKIMTAALLLVPYLPIETARQPRLSIGLTPSNAFGSTACLFPPFPFLFSSEKEKKEGKRQILNSCMHHRFYLPGVIFLSRKRKMNPADACHKV